MRKQILPLVLFLSGFLSPSLLKADGMGVYGKMNVNGTFLLNEGPVNLNADPSEGTAGVYVWNAGTLVLKEGLVLKSNDDYDGLLANRGTVTLTGVAAGNVQLHKTFLKNSWYLISFPFNVKVSEITSAAGNLVYGTDYLIAKYDGDKRARDNKMEEAWQFIDVESADKILNAGEGYQIILDDALASDSKKREVIFPANGDISGLFGDVRSIGLKNHIVYNPDYNTHNRSGWNAAGSLSLGNVSLHPDMDYTGGFQFYNGTGFTSVSPIAHQGKVISPYCAYLTQISNTGIPRWEPAHARYATNGTVQGNIVFKKEYNTLDPYETSSPAKLRSDNSPLDLIELRLSGPAYTDRLLIGTREDFREGVDLNEDVSKLVVETASVPQLWSRMEDYPLSINLLPPSRERSLELGVRTDGNQAYTVSLAEGYEGHYTKIELLDRGNGTRTDLLSGSYRIPQTAVHSTDERFVLKLSRVITGTDGITTDANPVRISCSEHQLRVEGIHEGDLVAVYNLSGQLLQSSVSTGNVFTSRVNTSNPVLLVKVSGQTGKLAKVINK